VVEASGQTEFPDPNFWVMYGSLPLRVGALPSAPYLSVPPRSLGGIGVCAQGSPRHPNDANRSLFGEDAARLLSLPGAVDLSPEASGATDFADTAEIIAGLDLVITVDTSVAHLAGGSRKAGVDSPAIGRPRLAMGADRRLDRLVSLRDSLSAGRGAVVQRPRSRDHGRTNMTMASPAPATPFREQPPPPGLVPLVEETLPPAPPRNGRDPGAPAPPSTLVPFPAPPAAPPDPFPLGPLIPVPVTGVEDPFRLTSPPDATPPVLLLAPPAVTTAPLGMVAVVEPATETPTFWAAVRKAVYST
jgi:hypothetical protein